MIKWFEKRNALSWTITILIAVFVFYFSSLTFEGIGGGIGDTNWMAILYHILIFFFLSLFFFISFIRGKENWKLILFGILILLSYGIIDEIHQFFVPGRFSTFTDVIFDFIGILFALIVYLISLNSKKNK